MRIFGNHLSTLELQSGSSITTEFKKLYTDILYRVKFRDPKEQGDSAYLYTIVEHQSTADRAMALRLLQYKINLLMRHVQEDYLPPIHSIVFYHGRQTPYPYNLDLRTSFCTPKQAEHTLQGQAQLIDLNQYPDEELLQKERAGLFSYFFKHVRDDDVLPALMALPAVLLREITQDSSGELLLETLMRYYQEQAKTKKPLQAFHHVAGKLDPQQQENIMNIGEAIMATGMENGRKEGEQEGMYKVALNMLKEGAEINFIKRVTGLSMKKIQAIMGKLSD